MQSWWSMFALLRKLQHALQPEEEEDLKKIQIFLFLRKSADMYGTNLSESEVFCRSDVLRKAAKKGIIQVKRGTCMNTCFIVGKIVEEPEFRDEVTKRNAVMVIDSLRPYAENDGNFVKDRFRIRLWHGIADEVKETTHVGDPVAVKGRIEMNESGPVIVAEHVSLTSCF